MSFNRLAKAGFTLLEILVAVTIIVAIVSMVYGSYIATIKSTQDYGAAIAVSQDTRAALAQITRQVRCVYVPQLVSRPSSLVSRASYPTKSASKTKKLFPEEIPNYFSGNAEDLNGEVLHLVTTAGLPRFCGDKFTPAKAGAESQSPYGLFEVAYRFDANMGVLSFSQQRFVQTPDSMTRSRNWQQVISGVESFKLAFFDGQKWLDKWDFKDRRRPPYAVKIDIICQDKNYRRCRYATVAYIPCQKGRNKKTTAEILVTIDELWD
ncbi:MAG: type II secretion system protein GspJ [Sedimentisphaerales bacterium]